MSDTPQPVISGTPHAVLDVRATETFQLGHRPEAANIPLEELEARIHELPRRERALLVVDADPARAAQAVALLRARGFDARPGELGGEMAAGPARVRLWEPNPFLAEVLPEIVAARPGGRALDLACGSGRDAVAMAAAGLAVSAVDILPDAIARARDLARRCGVALDARVRDLERDPIADVDAWDAIVVVSYLQRSMLPAIRRAVRPGGFVVYQTFLVEQRVRFGKPSNPSYLLEPGELRAAFDGWEVRRDREGLEEPRRFVASLFARKPDRGR